VAQPHLRILGDAEEDVRVIGQEGPAGGGRGRAVHGPVRSARGRRRRKACRVTVVAFRRLCPALNIPRARSVYGTGDGRNSQTISSPTSLLQNPAAGRGLFLRAAGVGGA